MKKFNKYLNITLMISVVMLANFAFGQPKEYVGKLDEAPSFKTPKTGEVLFDQMSNPGTGFMASQHYSTVSNANNTCAAADDFDIPTGESWDVHSIGIVGSYWQGAPGGGDTLNVYILADNNGIPGDTVHGYFGHTDFLKIEEDIGGYVTTYFEIFLPSVVTLTEGTYWVSVQVYSDFDVTGQWGWMEHLFETSFYGAEWHWINPKDGYGFGYTTWTPANLVVGPWLTWELSFALFGAPPADDLAAMEITSPDDYYSSPPVAGQEVKVIIKNEGTNLQTGFDVKYIFEGNEVIENVGSVSLGYNETFEYTFAQTVDLSTPGFYNLEVTTMLAGDENPDNNTQSIDITVFDPTVYLMPSLAITYDSACSGTFADAAGLNGDLFNEDDWGIYTLYPATPGGKIRLDFIQFDIGWGEFRIYDGENTMANLLGFWESYDSPGTLTASYQNTSGALTIRYNGQGWTPFEGHTGWAANIACHMPVEDDFALMGIHLSHPAVFEYDYVTAYATLKNNGTSILDKEVTFTSNGVVFATAQSGPVTQSDTVLVEVIWNPELEDDYELIATIPDDMGMFDDNSASMIQHVYPFDHFYEGFESPLFPPDGWSQSGTMWTHHTYQPAVGGGHAYAWVEYGFFDTLYTPRLHIEAGDKISFFSFSSAWWPGELDLVWIDAETGESDLIEAVAIPWLTYSYIEIDVSAAAGDNYLGFVAKYNPIGGQGEIKLDEVEGIGIERLYYQDDLKAYTLGGDITPEENIPTTLEIEIKNIGSEPQLGSEYTVRLMQQSGLEVIELMSYDGQDINPKEVLTYTLDYTFPYAGLYSCFVEVDFDDDMDISNNTSSALNVYVQQEGTVQVYIGENNDFTSNWWHPIAISATGLYAQTLYLAEEVGEPNTITGLMYYYRLAENYPKYDNPLTIWMSETDAVNMEDSLEAANNYTLVYEGTFDAFPGTHGVYIPLDYVYSYQGGNLMVTTYKDYDDGNYAAFYVGTSHPTDTLVRYYNGYSNGQPLDPYDQSSLDSVYLHKRPEYGNVKFFKFNLEDQYCTPQVLNGTNGGDYVDGVTFGEIENLGTGSQGGPAYNNYTSFSANVERGRTYELTIQAETSGATGSIAAWIDFNGNQDMDDEGEKVVHISSDEASQEITVLVTIPDDAALGLTILRVRNSADPDLFASCQAVDFGETEDYGINIIETIQVYNPVPEITATLLEDGNVDLNWSVPENPGIAQTEGFEMSTWPPANGWEVKQSTSLAGPLNDPTGDTWVQYNDNMQYVYNGAYSALSPASAADFNWLISPLVQLYSDDELSFMLNYSADANGYSKFYVLVEADNMWTTVLEYTDEVTMFNNFEEIVTVGLNEYAGKVIRVAFVSEYNDAYPIAIDDIILKGIEASDKGQSGITGYDIYRNGDLWMNIDDPSTIAGTDLLTESENYIYCIHALYDNGEKSEEVCDEVFYLAPLTPPLNVNAAADENDVYVIWNAPNEGMERFADDFENYDAGQQVACQNPDDWTTWTLSPCSNSDPYIVTDMPYSGDQSVVIEGEADLLYLRDEILTEGKYSYNFRMFIPEGFNGYFNILQDHDLTVGALWGMQVFFDLGGIATVDGGGYGAAAFTYDYNEWMYMDIVIDLDTDWAEYYIDGVLMHEWQWSLGIGGGGGWNTLEGGDFYAWNTSNTCKYFIDDFKLIQLYDNPDEVTYNIYRDGSLIDNTANTDYSDPAVAPGYHDYCVSAVYDEGESEQVCDWVSLYSAPENFTAEVQNENDVSCSWGDIASPDLDGFYVYRNDVQVSGLITNTEWTDNEVEGGTHTYYVTAIYNGGESLPSNMETVIILITPQGLVANANGEGDIVLDWESVGTVLQGEMIKLYQHDETPANGMYQYFNLGYGVLFDISGYPDAAIENIDFHHSSYGITGTWNYMIHIVDWDAQTVLASEGPFATTGDDIWEIGIPLGSLVPTGDVIGILLEPMSNDPEDAYPVLSCDVALEGNSIYADPADLSMFDYAPGDFLMDLWIWAPFSDETVQAPKIKVDNSNLENVRSSYTPVVGNMMVNQKSKEGKALVGYNIYYAYESDPFDMIDYATDTTYTHMDAGMIYGNHHYYITAQYEEGESMPSDTATEIISGIGEMGLEGMTIYPNPVKDVINIESDFEIQSLEVINSKGQIIVNEQEIDLHVYQVNIADQPAGIYNLRIETQKGWINKKMVKTH